MIYDILAHRAVYYGLGERFRKALDFMAETDLAALPDGRYELEGDDLFISLSTYETKPANDTPETHRRYVDIQYLVEGREKVGVAPLEAMTGVAEARPEGDIWLHHGPTEQLTLGDGRFMIFWPGDAHAPGVAADAPARARKCLAKIRVD